MDDRVLEDRRQVSDESISLSCLAFSAAALVFCPDRETAADTGFRFADVINLIEHERFKHGRKPSLSSSLHDKTAFGWC